MTNHSSCVTQCTSRVQQKCKWQQYQQWVKLFFGCNGHAYSIMWSNMQHCSPMHTQEGHGKKRHFWFRWWNQSGKSARGRENIASTCQTWWPPQQNMGPSHVQLSLKHHQLIGNRTMLQQGPPLEVATLRIVSKLVFSCDAQTISIIWSKMQYCCCGTTQAGHGNITSASDDEKNQPEEENALHPHVQSGGHLSKIWLWLALSVCILLWMGQLETSFVCTQQWQS
jgi:hypothetical protein